MSSGKVSAEQAQRNQMQIDGADPLFLRRGNEKWRIGNHRFSQGSPPSLPPPLKSRAKKNRVGACSGQWYSG